jgi:hypothetical protein
VTLILNCFILGCFGSIAAAIALLLGLHDPAHLSIATVFGIALPLAFLLGYIVRPNPEPNADAH